jgi:hypothetical protein
MKLKQKNARGAFTLVEMLVATALVMFIMLILSEAFVAGLEAFRTLKGIGDMEERLRAAALVLRTDLQADHFEPARRLSDPNFWKQVNPNPREGFLRISQGNTPIFSTTLVPAPAAGTATNATITAFGQYAVVQGFPSIVGQNQDWIIQGIQQNPLTTNSWVLVDQGPYQELVQVQTVNAGTPPTITANFTLGHLVINPTTGNPINPISGVPYYLIRAMEGVDADYTPPTVIAGPANSPAAEGPHSSRATEQILHMTVRQRGDRPENFFTAHVPWNSPFFPTLATVNATPPPLFTTPIYPNPNYAPTMFPDQPIDSRFQDLVPTTPLGGYKTQWAEVAYALVPNGTTAGGTTLYALYRFELKVVPDNRYINGTAYKPPSPGIPFNGWGIDGYNEMSCQQKWNANGNPYYYFNNPSDLATLAQATLANQIAGTGSQTAQITFNPNVNWNIQVGSVVIVDSGPQAELVAVTGVDQANNRFTANFNLPLGLPHNPGDPVYVVNRAFTAAQAGWRGVFNTTNPDTWSATLVATDVVSFDVRILPYLPGFSDFSDVVPVPGWPYGTYDTALPSPPGGIPYSIQAVQIVLRVWNVKTQQTRQVTIVQNL